MHSFGRHEIPDLAVAAPSRTMLVAKHDEGHDLFDRVLSQGDDMKTTKQNHILRSPQAQPVKVPEVTTSTPKVAKESLETNDHWDTKEGVATLTPSLQQSPVQMMTSPLAAVRFSADLKNGSRLQRCHSDNRHVIGWPIWQLCPFGNGFAFGASPHW